MHWVTTFPGVHHLKGGDERLKIWIEETNGTGIVTVTNSGTFVGERMKFFSKNLSILKSKGEEFDKNGFNQ